VKSTHLIITVFEGTKVLLSVDRVKALLERPECPLLERCHSFSGIRCEKLDYIECYLFLKILYSKYHVKFCPSRHGSKSRKVILEEIRNAKKFRRDGVPIAT